FDVALQKLPTVRKNLWCGVPRDITTNFKKGDEFTWWTINSCSTSDNIVKDLLGPNSTLFLIEAKNGKDISSYANCPNEVILCPGTRFRVVSDPIDQSPMHLIHLQEITDEDEEEESLSTALKTVITTPTLTTVQSSPVHIHTDQWGNRYEGEMKDGIEHGKGHMEYTNGDKYTGIYVEGNITGQGVYIFANGNRYEGQWKDNKKHGKGQMDFVSGEKYTGDYIDNKRIGQGVYIYANGNRYEGLWNHNKMHGKGQMTFVNGDKYTGDWIEDKRAGQGVYTFANGSRHEGQWKDNILHGTGNMPYANSAVKEEMCIIQ
ncbi:unnamed protein product, partial [Adineta steineri]